MRVSQHLAMTARIHGAFCAGLIVGCGSPEADPRAQWVVTIGTDAAVPQIGDRVFVEILDEAGSLACNTCEREFGLRPNEPNAGLPLSFAVVPPETGGRFRVRARLYRSSSTGPDGRPKGNLLIDA